MHKEFYIVEDRLEHSVELSAVLLFQKKNKELLPKFVFTEWFGAVEAEAERLSRKKN